MSTAVGGTGFATQRNFVDHAGCRRQARVCRGTLGCGRGATARLLAGEIWGQGFPAPIFSDVFEVDSQKLLKDKHLKLVLRQNKARFEAIRFNCVEPAASRIEAAYRLDINEWNGTASVQLLIEEFLSA